MQNIFKKTITPSSPFNSFWMAGYECSDKLNAFGNRVDLATMTGHVENVYDDYKMLRDFNIATVREGIRWSVVEKNPYTYDWSVVAYMIEAAKANSVQIIWDLCHFGFPDDLTPLHPLFARRFAALCTAFIQFYRSVSPHDELIVTPINEVSFLSWLGGEVCGTSPYCRNHGWEVKYKLMKAYIEGVEALKEADPYVRILTAEPLVNMVAPLFATDEQKAKASIQHHYQYQVTDMLCGKMCPELGGKPEYLDIIGLNYYYNNQWICNSFDFLGWNNNPNDERWRALSNLVTEVHERYKQPIVITETGHPKEDRPVWINKIAEECVLMLQNEIPLLGVCLYPIIDRPDWDNLNTWHKSGLWDIETESSGLTRILYQPMAKALLQAQQSVSNARTQNKEKYETLLMNQY